MVLRSNVILLIFSFSPKNDRNGLNENMEFYMKFPIFMELLEKYFCSFM
jgi:hypothetical protein